MTNLFKKWTTEDNGSTAIEFALVAVPITFLIIGIIELSIFFAASSLLHGATETAARLVRTGQVQQTESDPQQMFENALCDHASAFIGCNAIDYEAVTLDSFSDFGNYPAEYDENGQLVSNGFAVGGVNDIVLIRASYKYTFATPLIGHVLGQNGTTSRTIMSTIVLQTEPYDFEDEEA